MGLIKNIRKDLGNEKLPLLLALVFIALAYAPMFGYQPSEHSVHAFILTVLFILINDFFLQSEKLDELHQIVQTIPNNTLYNSYPSFYLEKLASAKELWVTGLNLRRIFPDHERLIKDVIKKGGVVNAMLLSSSNEALVKYGAQQDSGVATNSETWANSIKEIEDKLRGLKKSSPKQVGIKSIDYPLPYGLDAVDIDSPDGIIFVRYYPFFTGNSDQPILILRAGQSEWYAFYKKQLEIQWEYATDL